MDKNKIIEAAAKLVAKGAYDKAIKEYQKVLEADPKDVRILQKMGELFQKKNDSVQAAQYFTKVAESYTTDGFFLKAVALYKQVLKLDGSLIDVNVKLAELHQQLQLLGEAMAYYQIVANHYDKAGDPKRSLEVLKKMVDLDPDNVPSRVKLADLYVREGMNEDALNEFQRAAEHLKRQNRIDDYLRVAERVSALDPGNLPLARELAELYLQRNDQKRALAKLQVCFKADNRDIDTLRLLAVAFQGLGQVSKTLSVYKELASAYQERGMMAEAEEVWAQVAQLDPNDPSVASRGAAPAEPPPQAYAPQYAGDYPESDAPEATMVQMDYQPPSTGSAVRTAGSGVTAVQSAYTTAQSSVHGAAVTVSARSGVAKGDSTIAKFLTETDVYVKYGLHDKALEHLRKVFNVDPENIDAHEKAYAIYVSSNNHAQAFEQLLNVLRLHTRRGDAPRAQQYLATILQQNPNHPEVPVFLATLRMEGGVPVPEAAAEPAPDDAILVDSAEDEVIVAEEPGEDVISAVAMTGEEPVEAAEVVEDEADPYGQYAATGGQSRYDPGDRLADPYDESAAPEEAQVVSEDFDAPPPSTSGWVNEEEPPTGEHGLPPAEDPSTQANTLPASQAVEAAGHESVGLGSEEDQEVPTRLTPRMDPALLKTSVGYRSPAQPAPFVPEDAPPAEAVESAEAVEPAEELPPEPVSAAPQPVEEAVEAPPEEEPASEECDEASFFIEQGLYDEAREILETVMIAYPEHQRAAQLTAQLDALVAGGEPPPQAHGAGGNGESSGSNAFDIAQELANELGDGGGAPIEAQPTGEDYQVSVEEVFAEFKKGLEKVVKPEDVDTHYDLGIAYKEMGLIDDAIGEFTVARRGCVQKKKEVDCLTMIGMLQVMKGDFAGAIDSYQQALTSEHAAGDTEKALRYELAAALDGAGQAGRALSQFLKVQALDPAYRDVGQMVERLSSVAVPEDDQPPQPPKPRGGGARKVGYV